MAKMTFEYFQELEKLKDKNEIINFLKTASITIKEVININFNENVVLALPPGTPDIERKEHLHDGATLNHEIKKMYLFVENMSPNITKLKRESLWLQLLDILHPDEADDMVQMKDKVLHKKYKNLSQENCHLAFPEFVAKPKGPERDSKGRFIKKEDK